MYRTVLIAVDLDQPSSWATALPTAVALCRCFEAKLTLVTVVSGPELALEAQWSPIALRKMLDTARSRLASLADTATSLPEVSCLVESGSIYRGVLAAAERIAADLIVMASHRPEMKDYLLGANASRVVRHARCSVLVVRD